MRSAPIFDLRVPLEHRVNALVDEYGTLDKDFLIECTERISRRLGPEQSKTAIHAILENRMPDFVRQVLVYYDKTYQKALTSRDHNNIIPIPATDDDPGQNAIRLLSAAQNIPLHEQQ
jgi:tRNA 2-selenouridine synthase